MPGLVLAQGLKDAKFLPFAGGRLTVLLENTNCQIPNLPQFFGAGADNMLAHDGRSRLAERACFHIVREIYYDVSIHSEVNRDR